MEVLILSIIEDGPFHYIHAVDKKEYQLVSQEHGRKGERHKCPSWSYWRKAWRLIIASWCTRQERLTQLQLSGCPWSSRVCHGAVCGDSVSLYQGRTRRQGFRAPQPHWLHVLGNQEKYPLEKRTVAKKRKIGEPLNNRELIIRAEETQGLLREKETELFLFLRKKKF